MKDPASEDLARDIERVSTLPHNQPVNKKRINMRSIFYTSLMVITALLSGCGGSNDAQENNNAALASNEVGFFGKDALFGTQKLLDGWDVTFTKIDGNSTTKGTYIFRSDGVFSLLQSGDYSYGIYGIDADGKVLTFQRLANTDSLYTLALKAERSDGCIEADVSTSTHGIFMEVLLCPQKMDNTALYAGVNIGKSVSKGGYFGDDVLFGSKVMPGVWRLHRIDANGSINVASAKHIFYANGTFQSVNDNGPSAFIPYGVNEDGTDLNFYNSPLKIIGVFNDACYEVELGLDDPRVFCKSS